MFVGNHFLAKLISSDKFLNNVVNLGDGLSSIRNIVAAGNYRSSNIGTGLIIYHLLRLYSWKPVSIGYYACTPMDVSA